MLQLEGPTTKNAQLCTGGLWEKKEKKKEFQDGDSRVLSQAEAL